MRQRLRSRSTWGIIFPLLIGVSFFAFICFGVSSSLNSYMKAQSLRRLIASRNVNCVKTFLGDKNPDAFSIKGTTPLIWAVANRDFEMVQLLVELGSDPTRSLKFSARVSDRLVFQYLLERGFNRIPVKERDSLLGEALIAAASYHNTVNCSILLDKGADVNYIDGSTGRTPLIESIIPKSTLVVDETQMQTIRLLLKRGANKLIADKDGNTVVDVARLSNCLWCIDLLAK